MGKIQPHSCKFWAYGDRATISFMVLAVFLTFFGLNWKIAHDAGTSGVAQISAKSLPERPCWLEQYGIFHRDGVSRIQRGERVKTLTYVCTMDCGGMGDRITGIVSAFYAAIVLERVFIIHWSHPMALRETFLPSTFINWDIHHLVDHHAAVHVRVMDTHVPFEVQSHALTTIMQVNKSVENLYVYVNRYHVAMNLWKPRPDQPLFGLMMNACDQYSCKVPCIGLTPANSLKLVFRNLFEYSRALQNRLEALALELDLLQQDGSFGHFVGVHARLGGKWNDLPRHSLSDSITFLSCARAKVQKVSKGNNDRTKIVVLSDNQAFQAELKKLDPRVCYPEVATSFHLDRSRIEDLNEVKNGNLDTFAEFVLLSKAACIVGSWSGFSGLAGSIQTDNCFNLFTKCNQSNYDMWQEDGY